MTNLQDYADWQNLPSMFFKQAEKYGDSPFLWTKDGETDEFVPTSWNDAADQVRALARSLYKIGVRPGDRVLLVSENRTEWSIADLAIMCVGALTVPAYTTNTERDHLHAIEDSGAGIAIISTKKLAQPFLHAALDSGRCRHAIMMEDWGQSFVGDITITRWEDMISQGRGLTDDIDAWVANIERDQLACLIYTSGTGGAPKGVMLSHGAILSNCMGAFDIIETLGIEEEVFLSFLPLSHSYEHTAGLYFPMSIGAQIYYAESLDRLAANLAEVRPTIMTAVPRLYEMLYQRMSRMVEKEGGFKQKLFNLTLKLGRKTYEKQPLSLIEKIQNFVCEILLRRKLRQRFGGRIKAMVSGGGPLNYELGVLFVSCGIRILQGYGQTEFAPVVSCNRAENNKLRTVGPPMVGAEAKIADDGEILLRGESMMKGYWNLPEVTAATIIDGWLHTGDIGKFDEEGSLVITDRKKDIIVNSGGDNISPQRIEGLLTLETEISQAMVYGDDKPYLVAVLWPDEDFMREFAKENGIENNIDLLGENEEFRKKIRTAVDHVNRRLSTIEKVRSFTFAESPFSIDNEMLTPSMKIRRHKIKAAYGQALDALYQRKRGGQ
ncbi:long-chain acyl-CoA synthetase [Thalassospira xiamenensis M-5 = DSM 17429]|uniref:AMP-dependent synthetase/ligase n=1 Tax=Thalassospira xiamenensis M-5 = DSM 17429 TaxID=1123366 RepID=A0AB72UFE2_9PROT|nr:long-chain fatty acid--CoA ligase [Thalassospira xiamenensis]AJD53050.1 AMP-dependent synthetase/ligase [Thalassospira xiamenensis M-5 = DSM 17429]SIT29037.1 long-chain acyl-CoA synthetase [Thalassospira xiamenensis M-5 = DSM 17429]